MGMRTLHTFERGFLGGIFTAALSIGVTLFTVGAVRRLRERRAYARGRTLSIDSIPPKPVELAAQPAPEANASESPRLESESMNDVMIPSQRW